MYTDADNMMSIFALMFCLSACGVGSLCENRWRIFGRLVVVLVAFACCLLGDFYFAAALFFAFIIWEIKCVVWKKRSRDQIRQEIKDVINEDTKNFKDNKI